MTEALDSASTNSWITVRHINGDEDYFDHYDNFIVKDLKELLDDKNPNVFIEIIHGSEVLKDDFLFNQDTKYVLDLLKTRSLYSYHRELYDHLCDKSVEVTERETYYFYSVEYYGDMLILKVKTVSQDDEDRNIVYHREFYYGQGYAYLNFDRYHGEYGILIDRFEEFGNSFDSEFREFLDEMIKKCKREEEKRGYHIRISFDMPKDKDEIINSMNFYVCNDFVDYDSNYGDSDGESDYYLHPNDY